MVVVRFILFVVVIRLTYVAFVLLTHDTIGDSA